MGGKFNSIFTSLLIFAEEAVIDRHELEIHLNRCARRQQRVEVGAERWAAVPLDAQFGADAASLKLRVDAGEVEAAELEGKGLLGVPGR